MSVYYYPACITIYCVCNNYRVGLLLCISFLFILYCNVIVVYCLWLRFICIICVFVFYLFVMYSYLIGTVSLYFDLTAV